MLVQVLALGVVAVGAVVAFFFSGRRAVGAVGWRAIVSRFGWRFAALSCVALAWPGGPRLAFLAFFGGATLGLVFEWLLLLVLGPVLSQNGARPGSMVARALRAGPLFGAGVSLAALGFLASLELVTADDRSVPPWLGPPTLFLGLLVQVLAWLQGARTANEILEVARAARPVEALPPPRAERTVDIGVGEQTWLVDAQGGSPYRLGPMASLLLVGHVVEGARAAAHAGRRRVPLLLLTATTLGAVLATPPPDPPSWRPPRESALAAPTKRSTSTRTNLTWYPQPEPLLEDLNGDGVEDIIGLRWDSSHENAALAVVANDGKTFEELWRSPGFPAQWYGGATFLLRTGGALFMTDGEGYLRVFDPKTGSMTAFADVPRSQAVCGVPDSREVFLTGTRWEEEGLLIDAEGHRRETKRPKKCIYPGFEPTCPTMQGEACQRAWPKSLDGVAGGFRNTWEEGDVGVAIGTHLERDDAKREDEKERRVWGFDPKTEKVRFDVPLAFDERPLHANPSLQTTFAGRRVFAYYQQKSGEWTLGARDGKDGHVEWKLALPRAEMGTHFQSMHASEKRLYVALDHRLEVFDAATGASLGVIW